MLDALDGGIRDLFGDVFSSIYTEATLKKVIKATATNGDSTNGEISHPIFHHPVSRSEAYRASAGLADKELEIIVLAAQITGIVIDTDDVIVSSAARYSVKRAKLDGAKSQWKCVCKEQKDG